MMTFLEELTAALNRTSQENASDTPDFILAAFLNDCLTAWNTHVSEREQWWGRHKPYVKEPAPVEPSTGGKTLPEMAYTAYAEHQGWKNYQGLPIPPWTEVRQDIKDAWGAATSAVCAAMTLPNV